MKSSVLHICIVEEKSSYKLEKRNKGLW